MRTLASVALIAVALSLSACSRALLAPADRKDVCRIAVERKFDQAAFQPNPLSSAAGPALGAAGGAARGFSPQYGAILTVPIGALVGAGYGAACAAGSVNHPTADADFERLLRDADAGALTQAIGDGMAARQPECRLADPGSYANAADAVLEIERLEAGMGCLFGAQDYWILVQWRLVTAKDSRVLVSAATRCTQRSFRTVDAWFADPDYARDEIGRLLARTGQRIAEELLDAPVKGSCEFRDSGP